MSTSFTQIRIARPTNKIREVAEFYEMGLELPKIGSFENHLGYSGIILGMPDERYHLEFTEHNNTIPYPTPSRDNLLVFYYPNTEKRDVVARRLFDMGYPEVKPENPYWETHGITIEDPDGWRVVLMSIPGFKT